jgi:hypothetical protein
MHIPDNIRAAHALLSRTDLEFREVAGVTEEMLDRTTFKLLDEPNQLIRYRLQSWPTFIRQELIDEFATTSCRIAGLIRSLPGRVFKNRAEDINAFYGLNNPLLTEILLAEPTGIEGSVGRGDFILTESGFKCIEFNFVSNLGGWETSVLADMQSRIPAISNFLSERNVKPHHRNTLRLLYQHILREVTRDLSPLPNGRVNIAFVTDESEILRKKTKAVEYFRQELAAACREWTTPLAGELLICDYKGLSERAGMLWQGKNPVQAVVELYGGTTSADVFRAFKSGRIKLYNGPASRILSDKRNIALLSEFRDSAEATPAERDLIESAVPWSRVVSDRQVIYRESELSLLKLLVAEQESFVLKNTLLCGGKDVYVGRFTPAAEWSEVIVQAVQQRHWIAQEFAQSLPLLYQNGPHGCSPHDVIWGPFVFGPDYAGAILRMQPRDDRRVVNLTLTATEGVILEVGAAD